MKLNLIIDVSPSMGMSYNDSVTRLEFAKKVLSDNISENLNFSEFMLSSFTTNLSCVYSGNELCGLKDNLNNLKCSDAGETDIFGNIKRAIEQLDINDDAMVICATDAEQTCGSFNYSDVEKVLENYPGTELRIIDITSKLSENENIPIQKIVKAEEIEKNNIIPQKKCGRSSFYCRKSIKELPVSFQVYSCIEDKNECLFENKIRALLKKAVPYIENLSGLRYYTVPTFIVDEAVIDKELKNIETNLNDNHDNKLLDDALLILSILSYVSTCFHSGCFKYNTDVVNAAIASDVKKYLMKYKSKNPDFDTEYKLRSCSAQMYLKENNYSEYNNLEHISHFKGEAYELVNLAEAVCFYMKKYLNGNISYLSKFNVSKNISSSTTIIEVFFDILSKILETLEKIEKRYPNSIELSESFKQSYFKQFIAGVNPPDFSGYPFKEPNEYGNVESWQIFMVNLYCKVWERNLTEKNDLNILNKIVKCYDTNKVDWKTDLASIIELYKISINTLRRILEKSGITDMPVTLSKFTDLKKKSDIPIARKMHTFGVYIRPGMMNDEFCQKLLAAGYGENFIKNIEKSGKVLICASRIKKHIEEDFSDFNYTQADIDRVIDGFISMTLVHEHMHATIWEGIDSEMTNLASINLSFPFSKNFQVINESLAEWAGMNFVRNDCKIFELAIAHALSSSFPEWPYAGAIFIENMEGCLKEEKFKNILKFLKYDENEAFEFLKYDENEVFDLLYGLIQPPIF